MDAPILILYGSQTGNAQDCAERLAREAAALRFSPRVSAMDALDPSLLPQQRLVVMVAATTGQGDPPDNMRRFWRFLLRKSLPHDSLANCHMAVFGLGDSNYPNFNTSAKKLWRRLQQLGAQQLLDLGLGDDQAQGGYESALDVWAPAMWRAARVAAGPLPPGIPQPELSATSLLDLGEPKYKVTFLPPSPPDTAHHSAPSTSNQGGAEGQEWQEAVQAACAFRALAAAASGAGGAVPHTTGANGLSSPLASGSASIELKRVTGQVFTAPYGPWRPYMARVAVNRRLTAPSHFQDTRHIELDLGESGITYEPGDVLAVFPRTPRAAVDALLLRLGLDGAARVRVEVNPRGPTTAATLAQDGGQCEAQVQQQSGLPVVEASVRALVTGVLDIASASPRRYFFQVLQHFAPPGMERERLAYFATAEGRDELYTYNAREGRTVLEVLADFKSAAPPLEWLLEAGPPLKPRHFSIASSLRAHPAFAHLTVAVVEWTTPYKRRKQGLCSHYLASLTPSNSSAGDRAGAVAVWVERGALRMPSNPQLPLLLVGPGTGVAPFRAFLQERGVMLSAAARATPGDEGAQQGAGSASASPAPCCLYFGCRSREADYYYADEWSQLQAAGVLDPGPSGLVTAFSRDQAAKVYVTHKLREHGAAVWALLQAGGCVYVAGSANKMPAGVVSALVDVVQEHGQLPKEDAARFVRQLETSGRYLVEAWS